MTATLSNVLLTSTLSSGSFLKTRVIPFCLETTRTTMAFRRTAERRNCMGTTSGLAANKMPREGIDEGKTEEVSSNVNADEEGAGRVSGLACTLVDRVK